eukprot:4755504-Pleurochrysis_carterae.AAC.1
MRLWEMHSPAAKAELLALATEPARNTRTNPLLSKKHTPHLHAAAFRWLFVGFVHNLELERMVSRLTLLEGRHPRTHAITLDAVYNYHMRCAPGRVKRKHAIMRANVKGALREAAKETAEHHKEIAGS